MTDAPWTPNTTRNLCDKIYEKRKQGAQEIENIVKDLNSSGDKEKILELVEYIIANFSTSPNGNHRKGGLIALAAVAIGLGPDVIQLLQKLILNVSKCFTDQDARVRYYACESMYNITKVARVKTLEYFNEIFDGLVKLSTDPDVQVRNGAQLLDRLLKDIVTESDTFSLEEFLPCLKERIHVTNLNPNARQLLLGWIQVLDSVPNIDLLAVLPEFLDGLFAMLSEKKKDIRRTAENTLGEFLREIEESKEAVNYGAIVKILIPRCTSTDVLTRLTALTWLHVLVVTGKDELLAHIHSMVGAILPSVASESNEIRERAIKADASLLQLIQVGSKDKVDLSTLIQTISVQLKSDLIDTRLAALRWVGVLHQIYPQDIDVYLDTLFTTLLKMLSDTSEPVVTLSLEIMARIASNHEYFMKIMHSLIELFNNDANMLETRSSSALRQLSLYIAPEKIYLALSEIMETAEFDPNFSSLMIQTLNLILLTSSEFREMRKNLKDLNNPDNRSLFIALYRSWCHNPASTFSLCLMAQAYEHAYALVTKFAEMEITVNFLVEIDKLIQLIESPIFTSLRLQLLEPKKYPYLYKCMYGLLMLLPQSDAFVMLKTRLNSVSTLGQLYQILQSAEATADVTTTVDFAALLTHFEEVQKKHSSFRDKQQHRNAKSYSKQ